MDALSESFGKQRATAKAPMHVLWRADARACADKLCNTQAHARGRRAYRVSMPVPYKTTSVQVDHGLACLFREQSAAPGENGRLTHTWRDPTSVDELMMTTRELDM